MNLVYYPNEILKTKCQEITSFDVSLSEIISKMKDIMQKHNGLGLSANQVGILSQIFIIKDNKGVIHEFINPKVIDTEGTLVLNEGCLSAPNIFLPILRSESLLLEYQDITGEKKRIVAEGMEARTILHEYDHLQGKFYFELVNRQLRKAAISKLKKNV